MASLADANPPIALGALDGRYRGAVAPLVDHLSEAALNRRAGARRGRVADPPDEPRASCPGVRRLTDDEIAALRARRRRLRRRRDRRARPRSSGSPCTTSRRSSTSSRSGSPRSRPARDDTGLAELIHFGCTSEDVNNLSYAAHGQGRRERGVAARGDGARRRRSTTMARELKDVPMLAHTHGQPATPTTMGKELAVLAHRLGRQLRRIEPAGVPRQVQRRDRHLRRARAARCRTTTGRPSRARSSRASGLTWNPLTTQIESHDWQAELYADVARFNRILHNLCTDVWTYISLGYFAQVRGQGTVGRARRCRTRSTRSASRTPRPTSR